LVYGQKREMSVSHESRSKCATDVRQDAFPPPTQDVLRLLCQQVEVI
jgi:hypothetical protein